MLENLKGKNTRAFFSLQSVAKNERLYIVGTLSQTIVMSLVVALQGALQVWFKY
jgi:hypothetical protein